MNDFQSFINVTDYAIKNSSYNAVIISSCIFICYTIIIKISNYVTNKHKHKYITDLSNTLLKINHTVGVLSQKLEPIFEQEENKQIKQITNIINSSFDTFALNIIIQLIDIIILNHIQNNKQIVTENIHKIVQVEYYKLYAILSNYRITDKSVAAPMKENWINIISDSCISIVYNNNDSSIRIRELKNKVYLLIKNYCLYVTNKTLY